MKKTNKDQNWPSLLCFFSPLVQAKSSGHESRRATGNCRIHCQGTLRALLVCISWRLESCEPIADATGHTGSRRSDVDWQGTFDHPRGSQQYVLMSDAEDTTLLVALSPLQQTPWIATGNAGFLFHGKDTWILVFRPMGEKQQRLLLRGGCTRGKERMDVYGGEMMIVASCRTVWTRKTRQNPCIFKRFLANCFLSIMEVFSLAKLTFVACLALV